MLCARTVRNITRVRCVRVPCTAVQNTQVHYSSTSRSLIFPMTTTLLNQFSNLNKVQRRTLLPNTTHTNEAVDYVTYEKVCEETLDSLSEYFEELVENDSHLRSADVSYSSGVLTVGLGTPYGTYVINRQSPNRQIWLSSPSSGPKRYDYCVDGKCWIYKHDGKSLHQLLQEEISKVVRNKVDFSKCLYSKVT